MADLEASFRVTLEKLEVAIEVCENAWNAWRTLLDFMNSAYEPGLHDFYIEMTNLYDHDKSRQSLTEIFQKSGGPTPRVAALQVVSDVRFSAGDLAAVNLANQQVLEMKSNQAQVAKRMQAAFVKRAKTDWCMKTACAAMARFEGALKAKLAGEPGVERAVKEHFAGMPERQHAFLNYYHSMSWRLLSFLRPSRTHPLLYTPQRDDTVSDEDT